jgi:serine/threonine-protein kinase
MDQLEAVAIAGTEGALAPFFSPDGQWVGFLVDGNKLKKVSLAGGTSVSVCDVHGWFYGATWGDDNHIVFSQDDPPGLLVVSAAGGQPTPLTTLRENEGAHRRPELLPGGRTVLYQVQGRQGIGTPWQIVAESLETGERLVLGEGTSPHYAPTGHIVFVRGGLVWAAPFDEDRRATAGVPASIAEAIRMNPGTADFALARDGTFVYVPGVSAAQNTVVGWVDRSGRATPVWDEKREYRYVRLSPDGKRFVVAVNEPDFDTLGDADLWIYELDRGTLHAIYGQACQFIEESQLRPHFYSKS